MLESDVEVAKAEPPDDAEYHFNDVPVATKFATVTPEQKVWAVAVGAAVVKETTAPLNVKSLTLNVRVAEFAPQAYNLNVIGEVMF